MPTPEILELSQALRAVPRHGDLLLVLEEIERRLDQHWSTNYLAWFTDHGPDHVRRVAGYALQLGRPPSIAPDQQLTVLEKAILCAAALLHDVGMNDLGLCARKLGEMLPEDFPAVRHDHPRRSLELILDDPDAWGLPAEPALIEVIALVAQSHGTAFYSATLPQLAERATVRNETVRGRLLAALLLMADELDLHYERESALPGHAQLTPVSEAHAFKHRVIRSSAPRFRDDGAIDIRLTASLPNALSDDDREAIVSWIVVKLRRQMGLVEPELERGFAGQVRFSRVVNIQFVEPLVSALVPTVDALRVIHAEVSAERLIDHAAALREAEAALVTSDIVVITGRRDLAEQADTDGREEVFSTLAARAQANGCTVLLSRRTWFTGANDASEVLGEMLLRLGGDEVAITATSEGPRRTEMLTSLTRALEEQNAERVIVAVSSLDGLDGVSRRWLLETALPHLRVALPEVRLLATASPDTHVPTSSLTVVSIPTTEMTGDEVTEYFTRYVSDSAASPLAAAELTYDALRRLSFGHERELLTRTTQ